MFSTMYGRSDAENAARRANAPAVDYLVRTLHRDPPGPPTDNRLEQSKHFTGVIYLAICAIAKALAGSTLRVMKRNDQPVMQSKKARRMARLLRKAQGPLANQEHHDDDMVEAPRSDRFVKLFDHVNETDTLGDLLTAWTVQRNLTGTAFLWARPSQLGYTAPPAEFYVLPTALMFPLYSYAGYGLDEDSLAYPYGAWRLMSYYPGGAYLGATGPISALGAILDGREIKRHKSYHPLYRWDAWSKLTAGGVNFDVVESIAQSWKAAMDHGFNPDVVVTIKGGDEAGIAMASAKLEQGYGGARNNRRAIVTNGDGIDIDKLNTAPREMDYGNGWEQNVKFALAMLGVMPAVAGITESTSYAQLFAALKQFYTLTLQPDARDISQFLTKHIVYPYEQDTYIQIAVPEIDDKDYELKKQDMLNKYGLQKVDEARAWAGKEPLEKGGDELVGKGGGMGAPGGEEGQGDGESQLADILGQQGEPPHPDNTASVGALPGKIGKGRLWEFVESLDRPEPSYVVREPEVDYEELLSQAEAALR